jgi:photosystem I P700 chlorophyll a apoprotein A1
MVFSHFSSLWSKAGHFSIALSKGAKTTTWIWNLHADAHDFDIQQSAYYGVATALVTRKVFSSGLAHLSLVFFWLGRMHFDGAYFANTSAWRKDPKHCLASAHLVSSLVGQDILNSDVGGSFQGIYVTAGLFQLWRSEGIVSQVHLKYASTASVIGTCLCMTGSYFSMHAGYVASAYIYTDGHYTLSLHHLLLLTGIASVAWSSHQIHISGPINRLLDSGVDPAVIPLPQDLLIGGTGCQSRAFVQVQTPQGISAHHFYLAVVLITTALISLTSKGEQAPPRKCATTNAHDLSVHLLFAGLSSFLFATTHISTVGSIYPYVASDYALVLSLFYHHMNIAAFLTVGAAAHASIFMIRPFTTINGIKALDHRGLISAHLIYLSLALGLHSFGLYIHNDTFLSYLRGEDMFSDNSIQLKPVFAIWAQSFRALTLDIEVLDGKIVGMTQELGTADFMVHHIHAFTIHVTLLILLKGILYARSSRLVSDKSPLGFRYPCDGPGRGGTCQISPYDHLYLAIFWMYNSLSVVLFHYFWKMQSDLWGTVSASGLRPHYLLTHPSTSDFSINSTSINGWLRNFLWSQAAQVIQSYGTSISAYGLIFLCAHFVWAFSLMFLYSGRGYWQELIESILWAHHKLKIVNLVQPRALSISQGRAVGLTHYILGGIGSTWAFVLSRIIALS